LRILRTRCADPLAPDAILADGASRLPAAFDDRAIVIMVNVD
jgi:hypothetical protein